jgi:hypothetical protein
MGGRLAIGSQSREQDLFSLESLVIQRLRLITVGEIAAVETSRDRKFGDRAPTFASPSLTSMSDLQVRH